MTLFTQNTVGPALSSTQSQALTRPTKVQAGQSKATETAEASATLSRPRTIDELDLSDAARLAGVAEAKPIRQDLVARIKAQIDSGTYDLDGKKLDKVASGILRDLDLQG